MKIHLDLNYIKTVLLSCFFVNYLTTLEKSNIIYLVINITNITKTLGIKQKTNKKHNK